MARADWTGWIPPDPRPADPTAVPIYGCKPFVRADLVDGKEVEPPCPHKGKAIPQGSVCYCERCASYGREHDKRLVIDERERPKPEPAVAIEIEPEPTRAEKAGKPTSGKMARRKAKRRASKQAA